MGDYVNGLVSVIIPTYKRCELLKRAIDTVLNQTYKNLELLVVNDNIPGDEYSLELYRLINTYDDSRLQLIEQNEHINGAAARNSGIRAAKGEYIAFQDDDDYWEVGKIERQVGLLATLDDSYGAVSCLVRIYSNDKLYLSSLPYKSGYILTDILNRRICLETGALLIRRCALDEAGYFDETLYRHQDLQLFAQLASKYKILLDKVYLHNRENKDAQNRPNADKLAEIKRKYFISIMEVMRKLSKVEQKRVFIMHDFECAYAFIKSGYVKDGTKKIFKIFASPVTVYLAIERCCRRLIETKCKNILNKKYKLK